MGRGKGKRKKVVYFKYGENKISNLSNLSDIYSYHSPINSPIPGYDSEYIDSTYCTEATPEDLQQQQ